MDFGHRVWEGCLPTTLKAGGHLCLYKERVCLSEFPPHATGGGGSGRRVSSGWTSGGGWKTQRLGVGETGYILWHRSSPFKAANNDSSNNRVSIYQALTSCIYFTILIHLTFTATLEVELLSLFYKWGDWGTKWLNHLPQIKVNCSNKRERQCFAECRWRNLPTAWKQFYHQFWAKCFLKIKGCELVSPFILHKALKLRWSYLSGGISWKIWLLPPSWKTGSAGTLGPHSHVGYISERYQNGKYCMFLLICGI